MFLRNAKRVGLYALLQQKPVLIYVLPVKFVIRAPRANHSLSRHYRLIDLRSLGSMSSKLEPRTVYLFVILYRAGSQPLYTGGGAKEGGGTDYEKAFMRRSNLPISRRLLVDMAVQRLSEISR